MIKLADGLGLRSGLRLRDVLILTLTLTLTLTLACKKEKPQSEVRKQAQKAQVQEQTAALKPAEEEKKVETETYAYDAKGRRDPFLSIIEASKSAREAERKKKSFKPSETYDVHDIKVIAIARDKNRSYAMVQLPDKRYFTVKEGVTLGLYGGKVIKIDAGSVVVREYVKDYKGEIQSKDIILKLRKEGEE